VVVQLRSLCAPHLRDRRNDCRIGRSRVGGGRDRHVGLARPRDQEQRDLWLGALGDALKVQAGTVANIEGSREALGSLVSASQSAMGALQAAQAGNQLLALQARQLADLTATIAATGRAQALDAAERAAAKAQAREQLRRFLAIRPRYLPGGSD
jgi:P-type conjugative transfer protein TrbJ